MDEMRDEQINVSDSERWASVIAGGMLTLLGARVRGLTGLGLAAIGGNLLWRGVTGHCVVYESLGLESSTTPELTSAQPVPRPSASFERVDESSDESFPASDSPSWTPTSHLGPPED